MLRHDGNILLCCLLIFIVSSQNVPAQPQIAQDAYAIFEQSCFDCHGPNGSYPEALLIEYDALLQNGTVVPGNPDVSELYNRLLTTDEAERMPLGQPQLPVQSINTIRDWISAGAPSWIKTPYSYRPFISPGEILNTIETHLMALKPFDRAFARYFTMTHLYNAGETTKVLQEYRKGLFKLVNSLSWGVTVINPEPIDPQETIFYIDLRHYEWDVNDGWEQIEAVYPYHISFKTRTQTVLKKQLGRLREEMECNIPSVHVDWFLATASLPPLYHNLLDLPLTDRELEERLEVDVALNLRSAPGKRVWRAGFNNSGVSNNNRMVERHKSGYGAYWKSYDFAGNVDTQNIFTHPLSFTHDGGEIIFNLPNGLQGYYIVDESGSRLDAAPIDIVSNPAASDPTVRNGLSCFGCHTEGMKTFEDEMRSTIERNANPAYDKDQALRLYVEQSEMNALVQEDTNHYRGALEATGGDFGDIEPISRFHRSFQNSVDAAYAAAVFGLKTEVFLEKIRENADLQNLGLLVLDRENGSMKRDAWTSNFQAIVGHIRPNGDASETVLASGKTPNIEEMTLSEGGLLGVGFTFIDADPFVQFQFQPSINLGKIGIGIDGVALYNLSAEEGEETWLAEDGETWDNISTLLRIVRYVRYGHLNESFYARLGELNYVTIGHGLIMGGYSNYDRRGMRLNLSTKKKKIGIETVINNLGDPTVFGGRMFFRPLQQETGGIPILKGLELGVTALTDIEPSLVPVDDSLIALGADVGFPLIHNRLLRLDVYNDVAFLNTKMSTDAIGNEVGLCVSVAQATFKVGYRTFREGFQPTLFDYTYDAAKGIGPDFLGLDTDDNEGESRQGYFSLLAWRLFSKIDFFATFEDYTTTEPKLYAGITESGLSDRWSFRAFYVKHNIGEPDPGFPAKAGSKDPEFVEDLFRLDNESAFIVRIGYKIFWRFEAAITHEYRFQQVADEAGETGFEPIYKTSGEIGINLNF